MSNPRKSTRAELLEFALLASCAVPKALRIIAKKYKVQVSAIRLLNAVSYRSNSGKTTSSAQLQASKTGAKTLTRDAIADLVKAGLLERRGGRGPWLRLTLAGMGATALFQRTLRELMRPLDRSV